MSGGLFFIGLGTALILAGIAQLRQPITYSKNTIITGLIAAVFYVAGMTVMNFMYARARPEHLPAIAAIVAAFAIPVIIVNAIVSRTMPSLIETILVVIVTAGCVGLGSLGNIERNTTMYWLLVFTAFFILELLVGKTTSGHLLAALIWSVAVVINVVAWRKPKPLSREERKAFEAQAFQTDFREIRAIWRLTGVDIGVDTIESTNWPFKKLAARLYTRRFFGHNPEAKKNIVRIVVFMRDRVCHIRGGSNVNAMKLADGRTLKQIMALLSKIANDFAKRDVAAFGSVFVDLCSAVEEAHGVKTGTPTHIISDMIQEQIAAHKK